MRIEEFDPSDRELLLPTPGGRLVYHCLGCGGRFGIERLVYTCPECGQVLLIEDEAFEELRQLSPVKWRRRFDLRKCLSIPQLQGIFLFHELVGRVIPLDSVVYLGEGHTPLVDACGALVERVGVRFCFKNDGQNPSASFKDRGMAVALSYINYLINHRGLEQVLSICASTGDTSAAAALYSAYLAPRVKSAVLLPRGKVTPQQLSQPLGAGARVFEIPGVFDDCMKVVEFLAERYNVALLNSKNAWRILGQESYSYEVAQQLEYDLGDVVVVVPIGNAGNISAVMSGFIKLARLGIITRLPMVLGVQSEHADPVFRYYAAPRHQRVWRPVEVRPSVAQAAMIGNPVSMPRVVELAENYEAMGGRVHVVRVSEQEIMDHMLIANRHGHVVCTQGGECLAGLVAAVRESVVGKEAYAVLDATAHHLKFVGFQQMYFQDSFPPEFEVSPRPELVNMPEEVIPPGIERLPEAGRPLKGKEFERFVEATAREIARRLELEER